MRAQTAQRKALVVNAEAVALPGTNVGMRYKNPVLSIQERELGVLKPNNLRLEMIYGGVCGTDVHLAQRDAKDFIATSAPVYIPNDGRIIGHEGVARVVAAGSEVRGFKPGDIVGLESIINCQGCEPCRRGQFNQCLNAQLIGMQTDGIFTSHADLPASVAHEINAVCRHEEDVQAMACLEPAGVAWLACSNAVICAGDRVLVFGGGPIGYYCAMMARLLFGASRVCVVEPQAFRRQHVSPWCDAVYDVCDEAVEGERPDVVIEASGYLENIQRVARSIKANGRVMLLARSGQPLHLDAVDHLITNAISIMGIRGHLNGAFGRIIDLYQAGRLPLGDAVTGVIGSLGELHQQLIDPQPILSENCKALVQLGK